MKRRYVVMAIVMAALGGIALALSPQAATAAGSKQCYHSEGEPNGTCSTCTASCLGSGYLCCDIVIDP